MTFGGESFSYTTVNVWRVEDDKLKEVRGHIFDLYAWDELWTGIAASDKTASD